MHKQLTTTAITLGAATVMFGAAAMAQTPPPTGTPGISTTPVSTVTAAPTAQVPESLYQAGGGHFPFANPFSGTGRMELLWVRTDRPVKEGKVNRTWMWGPGPNTPGLLERYNEDPSSRSQRLVQYFDKSRMEINDPHGNWNSDFYVTNGLLSLELISGSIQVGEADFFPHRAACIRMTGDFGDTQAPTYAAFKGVTNTVDGNHPAPNLTGHKVTQTIDSAGKTGDDPSKASVPGVEIEYFEAETSHNIPRVFWDFLNSSGDVYEIVLRGDTLANDESLTSGRLSRPWNYAAGYPISEAYWTRAAVQGRNTDVLIQAYERRVLTYVPSNPEGFNVEMGNIGQHYFDWRYRNGGLCPNIVAPNPSPPVAAPTGTIAATTPTFRPFTPPPAVPTASITPGGTLTTPVVPTIAPPTGTITPLPVRTGTSVATSSALPTGTPRPASIP